MSHLAGQFAGIMLIDVPLDRIEELATGLNQLSQQGLKVIVEHDASEPTTESSGQVLEMNVVANDRPGIVREVTSVLAGRDVNVEEFTTECSDAPQGGGRIFKACATIRLPDGLESETLRNDLEDLATDLMIDFA